MRAAVYERNGEPEDVLRVAEVDSEQPGAGEIVLRMEAAAMHIADLRAIRGVAPFSGLPLPRTPGFEGIGRVARVGADVADFRPGDRAFAPLGSGTFREELRCRAADCLPAPEGDAVQLSLLTVNGPTAWVLLEDFAQLAPGDWIVQNAANSSCGRYLIRLARAKGVRTVNVVRRLELLEELRALGGDVVLHDGPDLGPRVLEATGGAPVRLGIDAVAGDATQRIAECLAPGSWIANYGAMSGRRCEIDFYLMFARDVRLVGVSLTRQMQKRTREAQRAIYARLASMMAQGDLVAKIAGVYSLARIVEACRHAAATGEAREGKVIVRLA